MGVTGHETDAMFQRYDIADNRDKLTALEAARRFASLHPGLSEPAVRHPELAQSEPSEWAHPHQPQKPAMELTRFRGHPQTWGEGVRDA
jgi:hypothetical protein